MTHPLAGRSAAEDGGGGTFLPREEWAKPRGRKSHRRPCGSGDRGSAVLWPDQPKRGRGRAPNSILGEDVADPEGPAQESRDARRRERGRSVGKGRHSNRRQPSPRHCPSHRVFVGRADIAAAWSKQSRKGRGYLSQLDDPSFTAPIFTDLFDDPEGESYTLIWSWGRKSTAD
jgi:uncharacterized protein (DUF736 family)